MTKEELRKIYKILAVEGYIEFIACILKLGIEEFSSADIASKYDYTMKEVANRMYVLKENGLVELAHTARNEKNYTVHFNRFLYPDFIKSIIPSEYLQ